MTSFTVIYLTRHSSIDSMLLANLEQMHWYHVPESCMQFVSCICRKGCSDLYSCKKKGLRYPGACRFREKGNGGNRRKADRTALCQTFYKFEIKIMSSYMSNEAWFQTSILYEISPLYRVRKSYCIHLFCICIYATYMYISM